ncbi:unnamed protein product, partial [Amoebophrya sp. A120]
KNFTSSSGALYHSPPRRAMLFMQNEGAPTPSESDYSKLSAVGRVQDGYTVFPEEVVRGTGTASSTVEDPAQQEGRAAAGAASGVNVSVRSSAAEHMNDFVGRGSSEIHSYETYPETALKTLDVAQKSSESTHAPPQSTEDAQASVQSLRAGLAERRDREDENGSATTGKINKDDASAAGIIDESEHEEDQDVDGTGSPRQGPDNTTPEVVDELVRRDAEDDEGIVDEMDPEMDEAEAVENAGDDGFVGEDVDQEDVDNDEPNEPSVVEDYEDADEILPQPGDDGTDRDGDEEEARRTREQKRSFYLQSADGQIQALGDDAIKAKLAAPLFGRDAGGCSDSLIVPAKCVRNWFFCAPSRQQMLADHNLPATRGWKLTGEGAPRAFESSLLSLGTVEGDRSCSFAYQSRQKLLDRMGSVLEHVVRSDNGIAHGEHAANFAERPTVLGGRGEYPCPSVRRITRSLGNGQNGFASPVELSPSHSRRLRTLMHDSHDRNLNPDEKGDGDVTENAQTGATWSPSTMVDAKAADARSVWPLERQARALQKLHREQLGEFCKRNQEGKFALSSLFDSPDDRNNAEPEDSENTARDRCEKRRRKISSWTVPEQVLNHSAITVFQEHPTESAMVFGTESGNWHVARRARGTSSEQEDTVDDVASSKDDEAKGEKDQYTVSFTRQHAHHAPVTSLSCHPRGRVLLTASADRCLHLWDFPTEGELEGASTVEEGHQKLPRDPVLSHASAHMSHCTAFHDFSDFFASADSDGNIRVWDVNRGFTRGPCVTIFGHKAEARSVCFEHFGNEMVSASGDGTVSLLDMRSGLCVATWEHAEVSSSIRSRIPPQSQSRGQTREDHLRVASAARYGKKHQLPLSSLKMPVEFEGVNHACFSPSNDLILSTAVQGTCRLWDRRFVRNKQELIRLDCEGSPAFKACFDWGTMGTRNQVAVCCPREVLVFDIREQTFLGALAVPRSATLPSSKRFSDVGFFKENRSLTATCGNSFV